MICTLLAPCATTSWCSILVARSRKVRWRRSGMIRSCSGSTLAPRRHRRSAAMLLDARNVDVRYGRVHAVRGVSVHVNEGEIVTVLGANGAGKSSFLRALLGIERIAAGTIIFQGTEVTDWSPSRRVRAGLVLVPEGRRIIRTLTVHENLLMGAFNRRDRDDV